MSNIQACITNVQFSKTLNEVVKRLYNCDEFSTIDALYPPFAVNCDGVEWTAPRWLKDGDIVFFMCSKSMIEYIRKIKTEALQQREHLKKLPYNKNREGEFELNSLVLRGLMYEQYYVYENIGGKIFAVGRVDGETYSDTMDEEGNYHWTNPIYAPISDIFYLTRPIDISEFRSFIHINRQGAITPVFGDAYEQLKRMVKKNTKNVPQYFKESQAQPVPLTKVNKTNYLGIGQEFRRNFFLERQFRAYYTDYLLSELGDQITIYKECRCEKSDCNDSYVDNVIKFGGKLLPVEIKQFLEIFI